jgi:hypothetical protein
MKNLHLLLVLSMLFSGQMFSQWRVKDDSSETTPLRKTATSEEDAFGVLDKGELINILGNQGMITDSYYQNLIYNFRWPKSKGIANSSVDLNAIDDASILFGCKGNVLDTYTRYRNEDWMAPKGARGMYHADDQPAELLAPDGAPRLAHSDIPATWPRGYVDSARVWHPAPTGPLASLSPSNQDLVLRKAAFYDVSKDIWRFWPGRFRTDIDPTSPTFGKEMPGQFAADREVYAIMTDRNAQLPSVTIGLTMEDQAYSYGRRFAEDIQFYDLIITNNSASTLDSCWWGYYIDFQFGDVLEETWGSYNSGINPRGFDNAFYQFDYNGSSPGNPEVGYMGMIVLGTPFDLGVTDGHFFRDLSGSITPAEDQNMWPVMISDPASPNLMAAASNYFHGPNRHFDDFSLTADGKQPGPTNWTMFVTTGPFTMKPGESIKATVAFSAGKDLADLKKNFQMAQKLYLNKFLGPAAPPSPKLSAVAGDGRVTLYWDDPAEKAIDPISKGADFEGYKIYRSQDQGSSWGEQIKDSKSNLVGYVPIAQFDKINLVSGVDPMNSFNFLGDNTGIVHMFVDSTVKNGVNYSYTITSYDSGSVASELESLESARGTTAADANLVDVTPRSNPVGYVPGAVKVDQLSGVGNGAVKAEIVVPGALTGDTYLVSFNKSPADSFRVQNDRTRAVLAAVPLRTGEMVVTEGLRISVEGDRSTGQIQSITNQKSEDVAGNQNPSSDGKWFVTLRGTNALGSSDAKGSDYQLRFTSKGSLAAGLTGQNQPLIKKYQVPYEVWNVSSLLNPFQINTILIDKNTNGRLDAGEEIRIINAPYVVRVDTTGIFNLLVWYYNISVDTTGGTGGRLPLDGESFTILSSSQLTPGDTFRVTVTPPTVSRNAEIVRSQIDGVRVVPNPYVVHATWEQEENNRRLRFMFLPPECSIAIYTVRGELVKKINHTNNTGDEDWNLTNESSVEVAFGLYVYVVETPNGEKAIGKFAILK